MIGSNIIVGERERKQTESEREKEKRQTSNLIYSCPLVGGAYEEGGHAGTRSQLWAIKEIQLARGSKTS